MKNASSENVNQGTASENETSVIMYPAEKAILPANRIIAYYGNFLSKKMGILGEYAPAEMWKKLNTEAAEWRSADPSTPVIKALHYIALVASNTPGKDGQYVHRMSKSQIEKAISVAAMEKGTLLFLDIQPGMSDLKKEIARMSDYLKMPDVHLGIDPEFMMHNEDIPGKKIGCICYKDINDVITLLSGLVEEYNIPPKILVLHRFTKKMVADFAKVNNSKHVQVVLHMDGFGPPSVKLSSYRQFISSETSAIYTGIKIFYKNDIKYPPHKYLSREQIMNLKPKPLYIQYQ